MASDPMVVRSGGPGRDGSVGPGEVVVRGGVPAPVGLAGVLGALVAAQWLDLRLFAGAGVLLSTVFVLGCVSAVVVVRPRGLVLMMITPPVVLVAAVVIAVLAFTSGPIDTTGTIVAVAQSMVQHFPVLAATTVLVLAIGGTRLVGYRRTVRASRSGVGA